MKSDKKGYTPPKDKDTNLYILDLNSEQTFAYSSNCIAMNILTYVHRENEYNKVLFCVSAKAM